MTQLLLTLLRSAYSYISGTARSSQELLKSSVLYRTAAIAGIEVPLHIRTPSHNSDDAHQLETCPALLSPLVASLPGVGEEPWDGLVWMAAPKKRVSHSRVRMRMAHKYLKPIRHYATCATCGNFKLMHVLCGHCLKETLEKTAELRRQKVAKKVGAQLKRSSSTSSPTVKWWISNHVLSRPFHEFVSESACKRIISVHCSKLV